MPEASIPTQNNIFRKIIFATLGEYRFNKGINAILKPPANNKLVIKSGKLSRRIAISVSLEKPSLKEIIHSLSRPEHLPNNSAKLRSAEDFIRLSFI
jgi:hypothetical protein